jgi:osmotically-inducible protein OsmY
MTNDEKLKRSVLKELNWEPSVIASHIGIAADNGIVTLFGHVASFAQKHAAEAAARRVSGVKAVAEQIEVRLPYASRRGDEQIAAAAADRVASDTLVPDTVKVTVEDGRVTLNGEVDAYYQKCAACSAVGSLFGVVGVNDLITIKSRVDTNKLGGAIEHALSRSWFFDPTITVSAEGGRVHLTGVVRSPHERQVAALTAWSAPGATSVQNDILVN